MWHSKIFMNLQRPLCLLTESNKIFYTSEHENECQMIPRIPGLQYALQQIRLGWKGNSIQNITQYRSLSTA